jgi:hypothetical protein
MSKAHLEILQILHDSGFLKAQSVQLVEQFAKRWDMSGFHALLATNVMSETDLANGLAQSLRIDRVFHVRNLVDDPNSLKVLDFKMAREWEALAVGELEEGDGRFEVVLADPTRQDYIEGLRKILGKQLTLAVSERSDIVRAIDLVYPVEEQLPGLYRPLAE